MTLIEKVSAPILKDPLVDVKVLAAMWIGGELFAEGSRARMQRSDAQALASIGRVEILI